MENSTNSNEDILFICNFLKNTVVKSLPKSLRTEFDNELLEIIYHIAEDNNSEEGISYNLRALDYTF